MYLLLPCFLCDEDLYSVLLTYRCDYCCCKIESTRKFPLDSSFMRDQFNHIPCDGYKILFRNVVLPLKLFFLIHQLILFLHLKFTLQGVKHCSSHKKVRKGAHNQGERTDILFLHAALR